MKKHLFILFFISTLLITCKKKTDIEVRLYNPYLDEYVQDATIAIIERKGNSGGGVFSGEASCKEVATATTDANGFALFNDTKLKKRDGYVYYPVTKEAWGITHDYPCGGYNGAFLIKGGTNTVIKSDRTDGGIIRLQFYNLFNPTMNGDSISVQALVLPNYDPELGSNVGGGGLGAGFLYDINQVPYSSPITVEKTGINGKLTVYVYKRKMGIVTTTIETVKAYPNQTTTIQINW